MYKKNFILLLYPGILKGLERTNADEVIKRFGSLLCASKINRKTDYTMLNLLIRKKIMQNKT